MRYYIPAFCWAILILSLSTNAPVELPKFSLLGADKIGHFAAYAILTILWIEGMARHRKWQQLQKTPMLLVVTATSTYGAIIELIQALLPHRSFDYADMLANILGALLGLCIIIIFRAKAFSY